MPPYRYLYRGQVEPGQLERHAEPLFRAADYYEITDLKVACERVLIRQLTIRQAQCREREGVPYEKNSGETFLALLERTSWGWGG